MVRNLSLLALAALLLTVAIGPPAASAAEDTSCNNASFMSRRCHFVFAKACKDKGRDADTCRQMRGYCHACTDQYLRCKAAAQEAKTNRRCGPCNEAYSACLRTMQAYYIDSKPE